MSEADPVIERCLAGDQRAWGDLIDRWAGLVYGLARAHSLTRAQCDDVAQTVFTALWRSLSSINDPRALPAWIATTTRRECWRLAKRETATVQPQDSQSDTSSQLEAVERAAAVHRGMAQLDERCRTLLQRLFYSPAAPDYEVISRELQLPVGSIGPTRRRCLAKLSDLLGDQIQ
jgi:RNA polymerase sigma factor (sigma-70 family)